MLTVAEARQAISAALPEFATETVELSRAAGRVLRQPVIAERDQPPFDRVTMDGIALAYDAYERGLRSFRIEGTQHAGEAVTTLTDDTHCIEIMTGAVLPRGTDCIIPVERIAIANGQAAVEPGYAAERRQFIHPRGSDTLQGSEMLAPGSGITPIDVAIIASAGLQRVEVAAQPAIRVVSTGDELVPPGQPIEAHQIRMSNGPAVVAMLQQHGFAECRHEHLRDDPEALRASLAAHLRKSGVLILSGGVSMGKADFVPRVLEELGVTPVFHKISQKPGLPMWFGTGPGHQAVFALPGNPVSTLVCCRHYVLPALFEASGRAVGRQEWALLTEDVTFKPELTCFLPVRLQSDIDGVQRARPVPTNTSGDFAALAGTDGYIELARDLSHFPQGTPVPVHRWAAR
jgi:molybdopterin molybdotransferase